VCAHDNLKSIADICFLLGGYVEWRKILDKFVSQGSFSEGSRSLSQVLSYSVASSGIPSPMASFFSYCIIIIIIIIIMRSSH